VSLNFDLLYHDQEVKLTHDHRSGAIAPAALPFEVKSVSKEVG